MIYITKDIHEKLDYVFIREVDDNIVSVNYFPSVGSTITVISCGVNTNVVKDTDGNEYPAGRAIVLWVEGGTVNTSEVLRIEYVTVAGRRLDEEVTIRLVANN